MPFSRTTEYSDSLDRDELEVQPLIANRLCFRYAKFGLQGTTMLWASGDYGVAGEEGKCTGV